jgi:dolichyl-phosphate-mannose--protein O-mannosyl transferase
VSSKKDNPPYFLCFKLFSNLNYKTGSLKQRIQHKFVTFVLDFEVIIIPLRIHVRVFLEKKPQYQNKPHITLACVI